MNGDIPMRPFPKARPRRDQRGTIHMPRKYTEAKAMCAQYLRIAHRTPLAGELRLTITFQYSKGPFSDVDNLAGGFMDAANGILWGDDKQVAELHVTRRKADRDAIIYTVEAVDV